MYHGWKNAHIISKCLKCTCNHNPATMRASKLYLNYKLNIAIICNNVIKHQIYQKQILKMFLTYLDLHLLCKDCHQGFFASHLRVQHFPIFVMLLLLYLLCSAVNPTIPSAILPLNPHKEWIGIARCCSLNANGRVWFKRNYISYYCGSVDIFM